MDVELSRAEAELHEEESALQTELSKLGMVGAQLTQRVGAAREQLAQVVGAGVADGGLSRRLEQVAVPRLDAGGALAQARAAREAALSARRAANAQVKQQLVQARGQLKALAEQVLADEQVLKGLVQQAQAARARPVAPAPPPPAAQPARAPATLASRPSALSQAPAPAAAPAKKAFDGRESQRIQQRVKMQAAVDFGSDNNFYNGFSANISDGGLFVATVKRVPIGTEIDLNFSLPTGERISAHGVVRWVREVDDKNPDSFPGIGVQFTRLDDAAQTAIERFVHSREPMFYVE